MNKFKLFLVAATLVYSTQTIAKGVRVDMYAMQKQMVTLIGANDSEEFQIAANNFLKAAQNAKNTMPASLDNEQDRFKGYQAGIQEVINTVQEAQELAREGKLDEAKTVVSKLDALKRQYHKQYK
ncbi:soluble cytochrome b562 [Nicoletella semolina]|uniref:Soluble cytochrome b562 n=1 Tax=Nicoletella semolina TaxID=271160 RepID=A0A4R2NCG4_9PAST|nr:cytochrome b562 [Nicoletella semolina]MDH2924344.1 cytochrome B562 [Nicoletella semolina]TCP18754.1 soluble cytochrome b562 [Nicoletella semolina]